MRVNQTQNKLFFVFLQPYGGIGRRSSLPNWCPQGRVGSSPITFTPGGSCLPFFFQQISP